MARRSARLALALAVAILPFSSAARVGHPPDSPITVDEQCVDNLRMILTLIQWDLHLSAGALPFPYLDQLYGAVNRLEPFICPADKGLESGKVGTARSLNSRLG
jgi:hypothetical protein